MPGPAGFSMDVASAVLIGMGRWTIAATVLTNVKTNGPVVTARSATGIVTLTTPTPGAVGSVAAAERKVSVSQEQFGACPTIAYTSDTVTTVNTFAVDGTTATDKNASWEVWLLPTV